MSAGSRTAWHRLILAGKPRLTKANVLATTLALLLGFAIAVQVRQNSLQGLDALREDELARILDTLDVQGSVDQQFNSDRGSHPRRSATTGCAGGAHWHGRRARTRNHVADRRS